MSEQKLPKNFIFFTPSLLDKNGEPKKFSLPSMGRDPLDEFDREGLMNSACLLLYLDYEEFRLESSYPITVKIVVGEGHVESEMSLCLSPHFTSSPKKDKVVIDQKQPPKTRQRKKLVNKDD